MRPALDLWKSKIEALSLACRAAAEEPEDSQPEAIDAFREVLAGIADLDGRSAVDLVRISPNDANNFHLLRPTTPGDPPSAKLKLAGEGLGHFQGLLDERWRRNDYIWARLDACEILLRTYEQKSREAGNPLDETWLQSIKSTAFEAILTNEATAASSTPLSIPSGETSYL